jgi:hypothetical protein
MTTRSTLGTNKGIVKVPHRIAVCAALQLGKSIAHELEPILSLVCQVEILPPHVLEHLEKV